MQCKHTLDGKLLAKLAGLANQLCPAPYPLPLNHLDRFVAQATSEHPTPTIALVLLLGLLGVAAARLGLAERTDGRVAVDLLVARQTRLHRRRLLPAGQRRTWRQRWRAPGTSRVAVAGGLEKGGTI